MLHLNSIHSTFSVQFFTNTSCGIAPQSVNPPGNARRMRLTGRKRGSVSTMEELHDLP